MLNNQVATTIWRDVFQEAGSYVALNETKKILYIQVFSPFTAAVK